MFRFFALLALVAAANAYGAIVGQDSNIVRSFGNIGQIATQSKSINTPFSSVTKSDVRVSNPGLGLGYHGLGYGAPAIAHAAYGAPLAHAAYAAPIAHAAYGAPLAHAGYGGVVAKAAVPAGLLGVAYSAAPVVSHMTYSNGLGFNYAW